MTISTVFAMFYPKIGTVLRFASTKLFHLQPVGSNLKYNTILDLQDLVLDYYLSSSFRLEFDLKCFTKMKDTYPISKLVLISF